MVEPAVAEAGGVEAPGLTRRAEIVDSEQGFFVEYLSFSIDYIGDAQHGCEIDLTSECNWATPKGGDLPSIGAGAVFVGYVVAVDVLGLSAHCDAIDLLIADYSDRDFEVLDLSGLYVDASY